MASTVVVLAANGRRANTKANPSTTLSEILQSACKSLRLNADHHALKHNGKPLDLSLTFRLSGLPNHTKVELVQASRSPSVVSVALQLHLPPPPSLSSPPGPSDGSKSHSSRLTGKFASSISLWQILRQFESGTAAMAAEGAAAAAATLSSSSPTYNFTERAAPMTTTTTTSSSGGLATTITAAGAGAGTGAGRLCYQKPVVEFMGRELAGVEELQRTLAQLGLSGGSALLRLSFRQTDQPLEDAIANISHFFRSDTEGAGNDRSKDSNSAGATTSSKGSSKDVDMDSSASPVTANGVVKEKEKEKDDGGGGDDVDMMNGITTSEGNMPEEKEEMRSQVQMGSNPVTEPSQPQLQLQPTAAAAADSTTAEPPPPPHDRAVSIFAPPPSNHTPQAATLAHNPDDYETTVESARIHQSRLTAAVATSSRNKRLLSDKEIDELAKARAKKIDAVQKVVVRVRLPDQTQVQGTFGKADEAASLYAFVRDMMNGNDGDDDSNNNNNHNDIDNQRFTLRYTGEKGTQVIIQDGRQLLTKDLLFQGRVLVNFVWNDTVPLDIRQRPVLKQEYREQARNIEIEAPQPVQQQKLIDDEAQSQGKTVSCNSFSDESRNQSKEQKMKRFLGKLTRK